MSSISGLLASVSISERKLFVEYVYCCFTCTNTSSKGSISIDLGSHFWVFWTLLGSICMWGLFLVCFLNISEKYVYKEKLLRTWEQNSVSFARKSCFVFLAFFSNESFLFADIFLSYSCFRKQENYSCKALMQFSFCRILSTNE